METLFCSLSYAWTDLESIWHGREAYVLTFPPLRSAKYSNGSWNERNEQKFKLS